MNLARYYDSRRKRRGLTLVGAMLVAGLTAFAVYDGVARSPQAGASPEVDRWAVVQPIGKTGRNRVVLQPGAAKRLDVKTAAVSSTLASGQRRTAVPYAAVLYDANGDTWTYTSPKRFVFVRHDIRVADVRGNLAVLSQGPRTGTRVVVVGAAELWGIEYGGIAED
jgi:hypothetical protein